MAEEKKRLFTRDEVMRQKIGENNLFIINNKVYDVAKFLNDHPGGEEILAEQRGKDATEEWTDVGHSKDAKEMMVKYVIGELIESEWSEIQGVGGKAEWRDEAATTTTTTTNAKNRIDDKQKQSSGFPFELIAVVFIALIFALNYGGYSFT